LHDIAPRKLWGDRVEDEGLPSPPPQNIKAAVSDRPNRLDVPAVRMVQSAAAENMPSLPAALDNVEVSDLLVGSIKVQGLLMCIVSSRKML
jgi:hypothetical protein